MGVTTEAVGTAELQLDLSDPTERPTSVPYRGLWGVAVLAAIALGLRLSGLQAFPLWHDEAWVAVSITQTSLNEMFFFEVPQVTPPLLLLLVKGIVAIFGTSDWAFRLWPALAGAAVAPVLYFLSLRLTSSRAGALMAMSLWAVNPVALRYSQELKQYTTDALVGLLLILTAERVIDRARSEQAVPRLGGLAALAVVAIGLSHVAVFFIAAVTVRIGWYVRSNLVGDETRRAWRTLSALVSATTVVFFTIYFLFIRPQINDRLVDFWHDFYAPWAPLDTARFLIRRTIEFFPYLFGQWSDGIALGAAPILFFLAAVVGVTSLVSTNRRLAMFYGAALFGLTLIASAFHRYPYGGRRVDIFLTPFIFMAVGYGLARIVSHAGSRKAVLVSVLAVVVFPYLQVIENEGGYGKLREDVKSVVATIEQVGHPSDAVAVHTAAIYAYRHYGGQEMGPAIRFGSFFDFETAASESEITDLLDSVNGRLWLVFSKDREGHRQAYSAIVAASCAPNGEWQFEHAAAFLYDCA